MRLPFAMATSILLLGLAGFQGAHAWGVLGHATVAYIAQNYVTAATESWSVFAANLLILITMLSSTNIQSIGLKEFWETPLARIWLA